MSERTTLPWLLLLVLAGPVSAQRVPQHLSPRIDSLGGELLAAEEELSRALEVARAERIARARTPLDTQRVGTVTVISRPEVADIARMAAAQALARFGDLARDSASPLNALTLLIEYGTRVPEFQVMAAERLHDVVALPTLAPPQRMRDAVERLLLWRLSLLLPQDLRDWAGGSIVLHADGDILAGSYRELMVSSARATVRCRDGDAAGCASALGLSHPGEFWSEWYSPEELRGWFEDKSYYVRRDPEFAACFERRLAEACESIMAGNNGPGAPLTHQARRTLLAVALERGGSAGFHTLQTDTTGALLGRLARAAQLPADELLLEWRERVYQARPEQVAGLNGSWIATVLWAAVLCALAMRSTRWRLG